MEVNLRQTSGPVLERPGDLAALLTNLEPNDVLFIDEIHRLSPVVEEVLYPAMEDFQLDIMIGEGPAARSIKLDVPPFTLVGATTRAGLLTSPLRDRFGIVQRLEFYSVEELEKIVFRSAGILNLPIESGGAQQIARRARGTPRIVNRLLRRVRDFAEVKGDGVVTHDVAVRAMDMLEVDPNGFDAMDRRLLQTIIEKFDGGPVGVESLSAAVGEERGTIEDVLEPYLIQQGFMMRTARGRVATKNAYLHFGLTPPVRDASPELQLFDSSLVLALTDAKTDSPFAWPVRVYYEDTDAQALVYYANYFKFMERARTEWIRSLGIEQDELMQKQRRLFVVVDTKAEFLSPAKFNDELMVTAGLLNKGRASFLIEQNIYRDSLNGEMLCRGTTRAAFLDADTLKPARLPASLFEDT